MDIITAYKVANIFINFNRSTQYIIIVIILRSFKSEAGNEVTGSKTFLSVHFGGFLLFMPTHATMGDMKTEVREKGYFKNNN